MANNFEALIRAVLDTTDFPNQVKKLDNKHFVKLGIDSQHLISEIRSALNTATFDININPTFNTKGAGKNLAQEVKSQIDTIIHSDSIDINLAKALKTKGIDDALSTKIIESFRKDVGLTTLSLKQLDIQFEKTAKGAQRLKSLKFTGIDEDGKTVSVLSQIDKKTGDVSSELTKVTQKFGETAKATRESNKAFQDLISAANRWKKQERNMIGLDINSDEFKEAEKRLNSLWQEYNRIITTHFSNGLTKSQQDALKRILEDNNQVAEIIKGGIRDLEKASTKNIRDSIGNGEVELAISRLITQYQKLKSTGHASLSEISADLETLKQKSKELDSTSDSDLPQKYKEINDLLDKTKTKLGLVAEENKRTVSSFDVDKLNNKMTTWLNKNTKASKEFGSQIEFLRNQLQKLNINSDEAAEALDRIEREFKSIDQQAEAAGLKGKSFGDRLKKALGGLAGIFTFEAVFDKAIDLLRDMYQQVYDIDKAMVSLKKVTDETSVRYERFLSSSAESAKELGRSISSLVEQTASWAKLGYSIDEAEGLAKLSSIYANVAEVSDDTAVKDMVTAMKAFNIEASKAVTVIDPLNELGNKFAVDAASLGDALSKSASAMNAAGTDMYKTLAMITGGSEITQNAGEFGNFLKVASMRLRGERYFIPIICESKGLQASINNYAA